MVLRNNISFLFKDSFKGFRKPGRKIPSFTKRSSNVKRRFSSDIYKSVPWNLYSQSWEMSSTVEPSQQQVGISNGSSLRSTPLCCFGISGLRRGYGRPRRLHHGLRLRRGDYCGVLLRGGYATLLHKKPTWKVCSQKKGAEDGFVEGLGSSSFWSFVWSTLQQNAGLVVLSSWKSWR